MAESYRKYGLKHKFIAGALFGIALSGCTSDLTNSEPTPQISDNYESPAATPTPAESASTPPASIETQHHNQV